MGPGFQKIGGSNKEHLIKEASNFKRTLWKFESKTSKLSREIVIWCGLICPSQSSINHDLIFGDSSARAALKRRVWGLIVCKTSSDVLHFFREFKFWNLKFAISSENSEGYRVCSPSDPLLVPVFGWEPLQSARFLHSHVPILELESRVWRNSFDSSSAQTHFCER